MKRSISQFSPATIICSLFVLAMVMFLLALPPSASMMTGFVVNSTVDSIDAVPGDGICADSLGRCTLRAAIMEANALAGSDTITVPAGTYQLTLSAGPLSYDRERLLSTGAVETGGDLDIVGGDLSIIGASPATTIIQAGATTASGIDRIFDINNPKGGPGVGIDVRLENLTLRNGNSPTEPPTNFRHGGGAIQFDGFDVATGQPKGKLTIRNCIITANQAAGTGGAIKVSFGSLDIDGSTISGNTSQTASGGGIMYDAGSQTANQSLSITNSTISNNTASNNVFGNGGGVFASGNANFRFEGNTILNNSAGTDGGGIAAIGFSAGRTKTITKNRIENNSAVRGDGVFSSNSTASISPLTFTLNVVVGNNSGPSDATSTGLFLTTNSSFDSLVNNWWGCNEGPNFGSCDRLGSAVGFGAGPWLVLSHTASPNSIMVGGSSTLQADFFTPSSGSPLSGSDLVALNGRAITFSNAQLGNVSGADATISNGKTNATYNAGAVGGNGSVDATVDHATVTASITVEQQPTVTTNPTNQTVCANSSVSFTVATSGFPTPTIQWQVSTGGPFANIPGATSTTLTFTATNAENGNLYRAVLTNSVGTATTDAATLTVNTAPTVTTNPNDVTVCEGASVSFTATADGSPAPTVQWQVNAGAGFTNLPGETNATLAFTASASQNDNRYRAVFTNACGTSTSNVAKLSINPSTSASTPADETVCQGATANFSTTASGTGPFTYQWSLDGNPISGATNSSVSISTGSLSGGNHTVQVTVNGTCGSFTKGATLTITAAPVVTTNPVSQTVTSGNVTFTAGASGSPAPTVQWQVSTNGGGTFNNIPGATSTSLMFATNPSQNGNQYRAVFTNTCGSATSAAATLTTCTPTAVTGSPASVVDACVGGVVNFNASATGFPTPTVQWQVSTNGGATFTDIPGATSTTLSVTSSIAVRNNQYRAVFTNACGTDTTAAATLGVDTIAPVITLSSNSIVLWPPNHSYRTVNVPDVVASATDNCSTNLLSSVVISSASCDEPENGNGDGNTINDIVIAADCRSIQLRAERDGSRNGRVYRINLKVTDSAGNVSTVTAKVSVPKTPNGNPPVDDGPGGGYTVISNCP